MKRVRKVYSCPSFAPLDSDDPRLYGGGMIGAALVFGERAAKREFGPHGKCIDVEAGAFRLGTTYWTAIIGVRGGCDLLECTTVELPIRIGRARGDREYYEAPPQTKRVG
jgi:hypothetical protein